MVEEERKHTYGWTAENIVYVNSNGFVRSRYFPLFLYLLFRQNVSPSYGTNPAGLPFHLDCSSSQEYTRSNLSKHEDSRGVVSRIITQRNPASSGWVHIMASARSFSQTPHLWPGSWPSRPHWETSTKLFCSCLIICYIRSLQTISLLYHYHDIYFMRGLWDYMMWTPVSTGVRTRLYTKQNIVK